MNASRAVAVKQPDIPNNPDESFLGRVRTIKTLKKAM
jgi:hypothetical protein